MLTYACVLAVPTTPSIRSSHCRWRPDIHHLGSQEDLEPVLERDIRAVGVFYTVLTYARVLIRSLASSPYHNHHPRGYFRRPHSQCAPLFSHFMANAIYDPQQNRQ